MARAPIFSPGGRAGPDGDRAEAARLAALHRLALLDTPPEREFDALVALAARTLGCATAMLNLLDRDRLWVKARSDTGPDTLPRALALCDRVVRTGEPVAFPDIAADPAAAAMMAAVTGPAGPRFYAGVPIRAAGADGAQHAVGTLCVLDPCPRAPDAAGVGTLQQLATLAEGLLAARGAAAASDALARRLARADDIFRQTERMAMIGSWRLSLEDEAVEWSDNVFRIHGMPVGDTPPIAGALDHYAPAARGRVSAALARTIETGEPLDFEEDFCTVRGEQRRVRCLGELERADGRPVAIVGVFQDVTKAHELETALRRSASTDMLTGLANRAAFERALDGAMARARDGGTPLLLALVDLDGFKAINDTLGHLAGDDVLRGVGRALRAPWLGDACAARLGGDEFALVVEDPGLVADPDALAARLERELRVPVSDGSLGMIAAGTVGTAAFAPEHGCVRDLLHAADVVLYAAKRARVGERRRGDRRTG